MAYAPLTRTVSSSSGHGGFYTTFAGPAVLLPAAVLLLAGLGALLAGGLRVLRR